MEVKAEAGIFKKFRAEEEGLHVEAEAGWEVEMVIKLPASIILDAGVDPVRERVNAGVAGAAG